jgi:hypothetical protein
MSYYPILKYKMRNRLIFMCQQFKVTQKLWLWFVLHVTFLLGERRVVFLATMHGLGVRVVGKSFLDVLDQWTFQGLIERTGVRGQVLNIES